MVILAVEVPLEDFSRISLWHLTTRKRSYLIVTVQKRAAERTELNMSKYRSGDIVGYRFDDVATPGVAKARVVKPTSIFPTGQLYRIEVIEIIRPSSVGTRAPRPGTKREVVEKHLVPLSEV